MTKEPSAPAAILVDETHKVHRKAAMYAILGGFAVYCASLGGDFNRIWLIWGEWTCTITSVWWPIKTIFVR